MITNPQRVIPEGVHDPLLNTSWSDLRAQAEQIHITCVARPEQTTEIIPSNSWYGLDRIIKAYAGWRRDRALKIFLPHGVEWYERSGWPRPRRREAVPVFVHYADSAIEAYRAISSRRVWRLAHPFVYLIELRGIPCTPRAGTVYFPPHSYIRTDGGDRFYRGNDAPEVLSRISLLPAEVKPVTICMYWLDVLLGLHKPYLDAGLRVVSAGHRSDPLFLLRLLAVCSEHRFAASSEIGGHTFYAIKAGCRYLHVDVTGTVMHADSPWSPQWRALMAEYAEAFIGQLSAADDATQLRIADELLGTEHLTSSAEVAAVLRQAERLDRLGVARIPPGANAGADEWVVTGPWGLFRYGYRRSVALRVAAKRLGLRDEEKGLPG